MESRVGSCEALLYSTQQEVTDLATATKRRGGANPEELANVLARPPHRRFERRLRFPAAPEAAAHHVRRRIAGGVMRFFNPIAAHTSVKGLSRQLADR